MVAFYDTAGAAAEVARVFHIELSALKGADRRETLSALTLASEWAAWDALRTHQGLSGPRARAVMTRMISRLLGGK